MLRQIKIHLFNRTRELGGPSLVTSCVHVYVGYGFVDFEVPSDAVRACQALQAQGIIVQFAKVPQVRCVCVWLSVADPARFSGFHETTLSVTANLGQPAVDPSQCRVDRTVV